MQLETKNLKLKFVHWLDNKYPSRFCWADCVSWAYSKRFNPFKIDNSDACKRESETHSSHTCYCGAWYKGKLFSSLPKEEQEAERGVGKENKEEDSIVKFLKRNKKS